MEEYSIVDALIELRPGAEWSIAGRDYDQLVWLDKSQTKPTLEELNIKLSSMKFTEPWRLLREERNRLLAETDWRASSDLTLSTEWKTYRQQLRDLPKTSTPKLIGDTNSLDMTSVDWPTKPS